MAGGEDDITVLDLALAAFPAQLAHGFGKSSQIAKMVAGQQPARGVDRNRAAGADRARLHECAALALFAPSVVLQLEQDLAGETVVELGAVDVMERDIGLLEGLFLRGR